MADTATIKELLEAGAHFGHQTSRWHPRMKKYIFTKRNGIHIIDLEQTASMLAKASDYHQGHRGQRRQDTLRRHQETGPGHRPGRGQARRHVLCQPALDRRHAHQFRRHSEPHRLPGKAGRPAGQGRVVTPAQERSPEADRGNRADEPPAGRHQGNDHPARCPLYR